MNHRCSSQESAEPSLPPCAIRQLCHCLKVTEDEVRKAVHLWNLDNVASVGHHTGAGTGCTACRRRIHRLIESMQSGEAALESLALPSRPRAAGEVA